MNNLISNFVRIIAEAEQSKKKLVLSDLPYDRNDLAPVMSDETLAYHYGKLAKGYVDRYNKEEGDSTFNEAGAFLHNIFFPQLQAPTGSNKPHGVSLAFIDQHYKGGFEELREKVESVAMGIQGSGWVYLAKNGSIKTITNHQIKQDIILLIDWWEHAWALDYQADKAKYLKNIWRIINWSVINDRLSV
jgi:Fe-Mn family superoxide dismutase